MPLVRVTALTVRLRAGGFAGIAAGLDFFPCFALVGLLFCFSRSLFL